MAVFTQEEVLHATGGTVVFSENRSRTYRRVLTDSREIKAGDLFVALTGDTYDGHEFVQQACRSGARGVVVHQARADELVRQIRQNTGSPVTVVGVPDPLQAYQDLARFHRLRFAVPVVAITGSNGKTTTKEMAYHVLSSRWRVHKTHGNFNNAIGVPKTLLGLRSRHQAAVIEMGVDQVGQTARLCEMVRPTLGVITNVGPDHLEFYKTMARSAASKAELLDWLKEGTAVLNADDRYFERFVQKAKGPVMSYGWAAGADVRAADPVWNGRRTEFRIVLPGRKRTQRISVRTMGSHNIANALAGAAVGHVLGLTGREIAAGLEKFRPPPMRSEIRRWGGVLYLSDCYNANPASVKAAVELLVELNPSGRTIAVLGDMLELGPGEARYHREVGRKVAQCRVTYLIACGTFARLMQAGVRQAGGPTQVLIATDVAEAGHLLKGLVKRGDVVLIKASRGAKMERILDVVRPGS